MSKLDEKKMGIAGEEVVMSVDAGYEANVGMSEKNIKDVEKAKIETQKVLDDVFKNGGVVAMLGITERSKDGFMTGGAFNCVHLNGMDGLRLMAKIRNEVDNMGKKVLKSMIIDSENANLIEKE